MLLFSFAILVCVLQSILSAPIDPSISVKLPEVSYEDLLALDRSAALFAANSLVTTGALQISNIPKFGELRKLALSSLAKCLSSDSSATTRIMNDGSIRTTIDALTIDGVTGDMSSHCGDQAAGLRFAVDAASRQLFVALDSVAKFPSDIHYNEPNIEPIMEPYRSFTDLVDHGSHIEHLHTYYGSKTVTNKPTLDVHMDSGLFIAMTTGYWGEITTVSEPHGVYIETPTGVLARMESSDSSLIIMVGDGAARWLSPILGAPLRAVPHALLAAVGKSNADSPSIIPYRSWYGKMFLPPQDAIVRGLGMTFAKFREHQLKVLQDYPDQSTQGIETSASFPLACGHFGLKTLATSPIDSATTYRGLLASTMGECKADELRCWMTCYSTKNLTCGMEAVCVDTVTNQEVPGEAMCPDGDGNCKLMCVTYNTTEYCYGSGVTMDMTGFVKASQNGDAPCFNLWFSDWTLDSKAKFLVGSLGVFFLGIAIQLLTQFRTNFSKSRAGGQYHKALSVVLYGLQTTVSYFVMLVAMTYSAELFAMTCVGLTVGYGIINVDIAGMLASVSTSAPTASTKAATATTSTTLSPLANTFESEKCCDGVEDELTAKLI